MADMNYSWMATKFPGETIGRPTIRADQVRPKDIIYRVDWQLVIEIKSVDISESVKVTDVNDKLYTFKPGEIFNVIIAH